MAITHDRRRFLERSLTAGAILSVTGVGHSASSAPSADSTGRANFVNPRVTPGRVRWHESFERACQASRGSGKPVFLFQMMGRMDERFC
jgi:hypothetical protein